MLVRALPTRPRRRAFRRRRTWRAGTAGPWAATRRGRWPRKWCEPPTIPSWAGSAWSACSREPCARTRRCTLAGTAWRTGGTRTTTPTNASRTCTRRWEPPCGLCRTAWRGTCAPWPSWEAPKPVTPSRPGRIRSCSPPWEMPEPLLPVAVEADSRSDEDALARSLGKIAAGDPTMRVERNAETHQLVLWCMGEAHADVVMDRLREQGVKLHDRGRGDTAAGNLRGPGHRARTPRQTIRGPRAVRRVRHRSGAAGPGRPASNSWTRRWAGSSRGRSSLPWRRGSVRRWRREYPPGSPWWTSACAGGRQGPQRRFVRRRLPGCRCPGPAGGGCGRTDPAP